MGALVTKGLLIAAVAHGLWDYAAFSLDDGTVPAFFADVFPVLSFSLTVYLVWRIVTYHRAEREAASVGAAPAADVPNGLDGCARCGAMLVPGARCRQTCGERVDGLARRTITASSAAVSPTGGASRP